MPKLVKMRAAFSRDVDGGARRVYPAGWVGGLPDDVAAEAIDGGFAEEVGPKRAPSSAPAEASEAMTRTELDAMARGRGLVPNDYRTKAEIVEAINAA